MRTRSQSCNNFPQQEASPAIVEPLRIENPFLEDQFQEDPPKDPPEVPMADDQTMAELLQAPTEGYEDAIVIPKIAANNFELKHVRFDESFYEAWERFNDLLSVGNKMHKAFPLPGESFHWQYKFPLPVNVVPTASEDKFVNKPVVENYKAKSSEEEPKVVRKNDDAPIIKEWVSDDEEQDVS
nr:reverse transcriptase domain-containing protein [Tanacetum cinerariifolium]